MDFDCGNCDLGDCGDCNNDCAGDCGCGDCKDCVTDCCDCNNLDCDCDTDSCKTICQTCLSGGPFENESRMRRFITAMIALFLVVAQWLTSINNISSYTDNKHTMTNLRNLQDQAPITEIGLYLECPTNTILLTNYYFPQTNQGCYSQIYKTLTNSTCQITSSEWMYIGNSNQQNTKYWGYQNYNQYQLCGKRSTITYKYLQEQEIKSPSDCNKFNLTLCKDLSNDNNFYCVNKTEQCPIRNIKFDKIINENYEKVDQAVIEDEYLQITRNYSTFQYLMNFNISRGVGICIDRDQLAHGVGEDYILNSPQWTYCDLDQTFSSFLTLSTEAFININGLSDVFSATRPLYNQTQNITLYYQTSLNTLNLLSFTALFDDFDTSVSYLNRIVYLSLAYWIYIVILIINEFLRIIYRCADKFGNDCKKCMTVWLFYVLRFFIQVPLIVLTQLGFFSMKTCKTTVATLESTLILDTYSTSIIDFSNSIQDLVFQQYKILQGLVFTQLVLDIIVSIWAYYGEQKKMRYRRNKEYVLPNMVAMTYLAQNQNNDYQSGGRQY